VNKFAGVLVEGGQGSLLEAVKADLSLTDLFPVHRLDQGTSGLVVFAKTAEANRELSSAFAQRKVDKFYLAITAGKPKKKQGFIVGDMSKARNGSYKLMRSQSNPAKTAFFNFALEQGQRLWVVKIFTGKTHQIRVALRALGAPIVGDLRYGGAAADRLYLHATQLQFELLGEQFNYLCPPTYGTGFQTSACIAKLAELGAPANLAWPQK
jgi:tRNA pseudouridine32 synthase/23S rRNA pseudouridine746 synthase